MPISLFYYYTDITDVNSLATFLTEIGQQLHLAGRIRIGTEGINGTFGGSQQAVNHFHDKLVHKLHNPHIDFKVSKGSAANFPEGWKVRICKELVTMGISPSQASWRDAAPHVDPEQFRNELLAELRAPTDNLVVLDVRNQYEHAIGRFDGAVLPPIRQFSDFPKFIRENAHLFQGKRVLMYCTGGIRCERASAFVQSECRADSVAQLHGGIDRFLARYPCGGDVFQGKNLVFDTRMAIGTTPPAIVGKCVQCNRPWDDYSLNWRCAYCRCRVLLCDDDSCAREFLEEGKSLCSQCLFDQRDVYHSQLYNSS